MVRLISHLLLIAFVWGVASGFAILSGPRKATLPVNEAQPVAKFIWDGNAPSIKDKDTFEGGVHAGETDEEVMEYLIGKAVQVWDGVKGAYIDIDVTKGDVSTNSEDQVNAMVVESAGNYSTAAFAQPFIPQDQDVITDCDITINDSSVETEFLAYAIAHELGHCLGLGHNHHSYTAMMSYARQNHNLRLGADDEAGLIYLYPSSAYASGEPKELISCGAVGLNISFPMFILLFLLPISIVPICSIYRSKVRANSGSWFA